MLWIDVYCFRLGIRLGVQHLSAQWVGCFTRWEGLQIQVFWSRFTQGGWCRGLLPLVAFAFDLFER